MGTTIRSEITEKSEYYISRHRYYELKHFCLQYGEWKRTYADMCYQLPSGVIRIPDKNTVYDDHVKTYARHLYLERISLIEDSAKLTDPVLGDYILKGVTEGLPYTYFKTVMCIPCCKETYYKLYRKFFWILSHKKDFA